MKSHHFYESQPIKKSKKTANYNRLFVYIKKDRKLVFLALLAMFAVAFLQLLIPLLTKLIIDDIIPAKNFSALYWSGAAIMVTALFISLFTYLNSHLMVTAGQRMIFSLRNDLFVHIQQQDIAFFDRNRTGELMSRMINDVNMLQQLISGGILHIFKDLLTFVVIAAFMFYVNWQLTAALMITFPFVLLFTHKFRDKLRQSYRKVQESIAQVSSHLQDTLSGIRLVKSFSRDDYELSRFTKHNETNKEANVTAARYSAIFQPSIELFNTVGMLIVIIFGALLTIQGKLTIGAIVAFLAYLRLLQNPIRQFGRIVNTFHQSAAAYERINEIFDTSPMLIDKEGSINLKNLRGQIQFRNVSFAYQANNTVIENFHLDIPPGKMVAIVGSSGAGKSTLTYLLSRFYDPCHGAIFIDGIPLQGITLKSLRSQIGIVSQDVFLFNGTIKENIAYGKPSASEQEIIAAAKAANAAQFILNLPKGYESEIGERGLRLSGGQKQRIAIARTLLKDPKIILLDEATSALDTETEKIIQDSLSFLLKGRTSIVIAHRLSTIRAADMIVVMEHGKIIELGTHNELLSKNGKYRAMHQTS